MTTWARAGTSTVSRSDCLIYDLYLDTLGGGERVVFAAADALSDEFDVTIAGPRVPDTARLERFGLSSDLRLLQLHPAHFPLATRGVDLVLYLANGVPLPSFARRSLLVLQFPFESLTHWPGLRRAQRWALAQYDVLVYSEFVATWTRRRLGVDPTILHPPGHLADEPSIEKEHIILAVGRFFDVEHAKRHDVLIDAYRHLPAAVRSSWPLVLAGGVDGRASGQRYLDRLRTLAQGLNIRFELDVPQSRLHELYARTSLFWHATGYGRAPEQPERAEHYGLSTIEAMSHGAVPLVYADGGQTEIVTETSGVLWRVLDELVVATTSLIDDGEARRRMADAAARRAQEFPPEAFRQGLLDRVHRMP